MRYEIAGEEYLTKKAIERRYRSIINVGEAGRIISGGVDFDFLLALTRNHDRRSEKTGCGIKAFQITSDGKYRTVLIIRHNGSVTDISFLKVIRRLGWSPKMKIREDVAKAMRCEIVDQINEFRQHEMKSVLKPVEFVNGECVIPEVVIGNDISTYIMMINMEVDHYIPSFAELVEAWLISQEINYIEIAINHGQMREPTLFVDRDLARDWSEYHRNNATLRMISKQENMSRKTPKVNWDKIEQLTS